MIVRRLFILVVTVSFFLGLAVLASAGEEQAQAPAAKEDRVSGTIQMINKDTRTITVRTSSNVQRMVDYNDQTKFTKRNEPGGSAADLKDGVRIICVGKFDAKTHLVADRIDFR